MNDGPVLDIMHRHSLLPAAQMHKTIAMALIVFSLPALTFAHESKTSAQTTLLHQCGMFCMTIDVYSQHDGYRPVTALIAGHCPAGLTAYLMLCRA